MTDDELKAIDQRLAAMSERVERVIAKEKPLGKRMPILDFKPRRIPAQGGSPGDGLLHGRGTGLKARYVPPDPDLERHHESLREYYADLRSRETGTYLDDIFADFERQFDEMAQAHRNRA